MAWKSGADGQRFSNISAATGSFPLSGGSYGVTVTATFGGGSIALQRQAADDSTWITCLTPFTTAGYASVNLPNGTYRFGVATATAVYADIVPIASVQA
jgi:hypothetical protein